MKENYFFVFQKREREKKKDHPVKEGHTRNATIPQKKRKEKKKNSDSDELQQRAI
jgi:hypothetical protein